MSTVKHWNNDLRDTALSLSLQALQNNLQRLVSETTAVHLILFQYRAVLNSTWFLMSLQALPLSCFYSSDLIETH